MVPCGSGNGMAASAGLWTPATAAHAVCKGCTRGMDIMSLFQPPDRRYYAFLSLTFGLIANLDIGTESLRSASFPSVAEDPMCLTSRPQNISSVIGRLPTSSSSRRACTWGAPCQQVTEAGLAAGGWGPPVFRSEP